MSADEHNDAFRLAAEYVNEGRFAEALAIFAGLVDGDLDEFGKSMACVNAAIVHDKMGQVDQALRWYDRGIALERAIDRYFVALHKASYCLEKERHTEALAMSTMLVASGTSDLDKANACLNAAGVCEKLGQTDTALQWYDRGINYERQHSRFNVAEHKAAYLVGKGRTKESRMIYGRIVTEASLTEADKDRIRYNLSIIKD
jgi:tetratricopeptide (TPR) repeat protein